MSYNAWRDFVRLDSMPDERSRDVRYTLVYDIISVLGLYHAMQGFLLHLLYYMCKAMK